MMRRLLVGIGVILAVLTLVAIPFYLFWMFMIAAGSILIPDVPAHLVYLLMAMPALLLAALWFVLLRVLRRYPPPPDASTGQSS